MNDLAELERDFFLSCSKHGGANWEESGAREAGLDGCHNAAFQRGFLRSSTLPRRKCGLSLVYRTADGRGTMGMCHGYFSGLACRDLRLARLVGMYAFGAEMEAYVVRPNA